MADENKHDSHEAAEKGGESPAARPAPSGEEPPAPSGGGEQAEFLESGRTPPPYAGPPRPSRWHRWSSNGTVRAGGLTLVAGLVGGLVGGGIVAAFDHDHGVDRTGPVRFHPNMERGMPGFRGPDGWGPPGGGFQYHRMPDRPVPPDQPATPTPVPTPKSSG